MLKKIRIGLTFAAIVSVGILIAFAAMEVDMDIEATQLQADERVREYVISYDIAFVKEELIALHRAHWNAHVAENNAVRLRMLILIPIILLLIWWVIVDLRKRGASRRE